MILTTKDGILLELVRSSDQVSDVGLEMAHGCQVIIEGFEKFSETC